MAHRFEVTGGRVQIDAFYCWCDHQYPRLPRTVYGAFQRARTVSRQRTQLTLSRRSISDGERFLQALNSRFLQFAPISYVSPQNSCRFDPIYHTARRLGWCTKGLICAKLSRRKPILKICGNGCFVRSTLEKARSRPQKPLLFESPPSNAIFDNDEKPVMCCQRRSQVVLPEKERCCRPT